MTGKSPRSPPMQDAGVSVAKATATPSGKVGSPARIDGQAPHPQAALDRAARANLARMTAGISPHAVVDARNDLAMHPRCALLFPSFAVERAQELISDLGRLMAEGSLPVIPVHVDCPLATKATHVFAEHHKALEAGAVLMKGLRSRHPH